MMMNFRRLFIAVPLNLVIAMLGSDSFAAQIQVSSVKPNAYFVQNSQGLFKGLYLKEKSVKFTPEDRTKCGQVLQRRLKSLMFSCTLEIDSKAKVSKLREQVTPRAVNVGYGRLNKAVSVDVAEDGKSVTFTLSFDDTGFDYDVSKFNDEFFAVYAKTAQLIIIEVMNKNLQLKVLEDEA